MLANFTAVHLVSSNLQSKIFNLKWMSRVFPRCAELLPWVLRICGRAAGGAWRGGGGATRVGWGGGRDDGSGSWLLAVDFRLWTFGRLFWGCWSESVWRSRIFW